MNNELLNDFACQVIKHYGMLNKKRRINEKELREAREALSETRTGNHVSEMVLRTRISEAEARIEQIKIDQATCDEVLRRIYKSDEP